MIQNTDLMEAAIKVAECVKTSSEIKDFILEQFNTDNLNVYIGDMLRNQLPDASKTPYVVFYDWNKREGLDIEFCKYTCSIAIGVGSGARPDFVYSDEDVMFLDAYDVSNKFTQLIIDVINNRNDKQRPLSSVEVKAPVVVDSDGGHWGTIVDCTWRIYQTMGNNQEEF